MRYFETKEGSAELLRLALPLMARQNAAYHPLSYALWYEHLAGINPRLGDLLVARLEENSPLTEEEVYRLYGRYIAGRDLETQEHWQQHVRALLSQVAQDALAAGTEAAEFGKCLESRQAQLAAATSPEEAMQAIARLVEETQRVQSSNCAVAQRLRSKAEQIEVLAQRLEQGQAEALIDPLCGLRNRRGFERAVAEVFTADSGCSVALLLADVDHFKQLNDTYGHLLGDKVLCAIAHTMQTNVKGRDVAARYGGDEFSVLLPQTTIYGAQALAEQIRAAVATGCIQRLDGQFLRGGVTVSIGVAIGDTTEGFEALMAQADAALYQAKRTGRNRVCLAVA